jgi:glycosyltransferase involved in cell wall biosynthesis
MGGSSRLLVSAAALLRAVPPARWLVRRLPPRVRGAARRVFAQPASAARDGAMRGAPPAPTARTPFVADGSGAAPRVNIIGHFRGEFGMAEAARSLVVAARAARVEVALVSAAPMDARGADLRLADAIGEHAPHPINIICVNANETARLLDRLDSALTDARYLIGFWFWELARLPVAWQDSVARVDEIWVASEFVAETMRAATRKPVHTVPLAIDATPSRTYRRSEFGLDEDPYTFLFTFNFNSWASRKNPIATIDTFRAAFPDDDPDVALVVKSMNVDRDGERMGRLREAIEADRRIKFIDRSMSRDEVFGLESVVDCYVSLHRSEGFGLGLAESMFLGKPVIGTAYSGNLEFMTERNSLLVDYRLVPVGPGEYPFPEGQVWAEPDQRQAAAFMRRLAGDPTLGRRIGAQARSDLLHGFSPQVAGAEIARRISAILDGQV